MILRITNIVIGMFLITGIFVLLGFAVSSNSKLPVQKVQITVEHGQGNDFVDARHIQSFINPHLTTEKNLPVRQGQLEEIEKLISGIPHIERVHVYQTIDGAIHIKASQRKPLVRVINSQNESYYIDVNGGLLPLSNNYTARVIVATGHIQAPYSPVVDLKEPIPAGEVLRNEKRLREVYELALFISGDSFWNAFIDQIYVTSKGEFELIPKNGNHIVEFGKLENMEKKFGKLLTFYQSGLTRVGWHQYKRINIKFSNQVICSK